MKRSEMVRLVDELIDNIMSDYEPDEVEEAGNLLESIFDDCLATFLQMQADLNRKEPS